MIYKADNNVRQKLVEMFDDFDSTIVLSYLQGHMGSAWVDNLENPTVAQITVGIFCSFTPESKRRRGGRIII
ncbi:GNAT family N-acetyltransferase [Bacillus pacificus]